MVAGNFKKTVMRLHDSVQTPIGSADMTASAVQSEQLSAWMDGELSAHDAQHLIADLLQSKERQEQLRVWHFVGDAVRSHETAAFHSSALCGRIHQSIQSEPGLLAPNALQKIWARRHLRLVRPLGTGMAIAAAAAMVFWVALPQWRSGLVPPLPGTPSVVQAPVSTVAHLELTPSSRQLAQLSPSGNTPDPLIENYLLEHHELAGSGLMPAAAQVYVPYRPEESR